MIRRFLFYLALEAPYVPFRPWVLGLALGRMPHREDDWDEEAWQAKQQAKEPAEFLESFDIQVAELDRKDRL